MGGGERAIEREGRREVEVMICCLDTFANIFEVKVLRKREKKKKRRG